MFIEKTLRELNKNEGKSNNEKSWQKIIAIL